MFENLGGNKERALHIGRETFEDMYEQNPESAFAENIRSVAEYLTDGDIAAQMTQEGAELDQEYIETLRSIRRFLTSQNLESGDLGHVEALTLNLIGDRLKEPNESFATYLAMVQSGASKLHGME